MASPQVPILPLPPNEYDRAYMDNLIRVLNLYFRQDSTPGPLSATTINISNLPTSPTGLRAGDLWNNAGVVNIV